MVATQPCCYPPWRLARCGRRRRSREAGPRGAGCRGARSQQPLFSPRAVRTAGVPERAAGGAASGRGRQFPLGNTSVPGHAGLRQRSGCPSQPTCHADLYSHAHFGTGARWAATYCGAAGKNRTDLPERGEGPFAENRRGDPRGSAGDTAPTHRRQIGVDRGEARRRRRRPACRLLPSGAISRPWPRWRCSWTTPGVSWVPTPWASMGARGCWRACACEQIVASRRSPATFDGAPFGVVGMAGVCRPHC
mmetsp:Transcript_108893/g.313649  ORF Transcript_108893/g.313649 Transcript_108893/m.313649 type:complete len:249 (-) Transcript_108893:112-858(-)